MGRFCAKCGRPYSEGVVFVGNLCIRCYLEENRVLDVPSEVEVQLCKNCFSYRIKGRWLKPLTYGSPEEIVKEALAKVIEDKVRIREVHGSSGKIKVTYNVEMPLEIHSTQFPITIVAKVEAGREVYEQRYPVVAKVTFTLCPNCLMRVSKTYKAIVQVRSARDRIDRMDRRKINRILREIDPYNIIDVEEVREGLNIKVSDATTARILASKIRNEMGATVSESFEHVRRNREGKRTSKLVIVVRLPKFRENDLVMFRNDMFRIVKISGFRVVLRNERNNAKTTVSAEALWDGRISGIPETTVYKKYLVIGRNDRVVYVVDASENYEVKEIPLGYVSENVKPGDELKVAIINGKPYVLGKA